MNRETIFFPLGLGDVVTPHSWLTKEGARFCFGNLDGCPFCASTDRLTVDAKPVHSKLNQKEAG